MINKYNNLHPPFNAISPISFSYLVLLASRLETMFHNSHDSGCLIQWVYCQTKAV